MGLPQYLPQFRDDQQLEQNDATYAAIERMHGGGDERDIFNFAARAEHRAPASVQRPMLVGHRGGNDRGTMRGELDADASDSDIFREVMR